MCGRIFHFRLAFAAMAAEAGAAKFDLTQPDWALGAAGSVATQREREPDGQPRQKTKREEEGKGGGARGGGGAGAGGRNSDEVRSLLEAVAKLSVATATDLREVQGIAYRTYLLPAQHALVAAMQAAGKAYHEEAARDPRGHSLGPPHIHVWLALVRCLLSPDMRKQLSEEVVAKLENYWQSQVVGRPREQVEFQVRHCRLKPAYKEIQFKLTLATDFPELADLLHTALGQAGATVKGGAAPAGPLEREARQLLQRFRG